MAKKSPAKKTAKADDAQAKVAELEAKLDDAVALAKAELEGDPGFIEAIEKRVGGKIGAEIRPLVQDLINKTNGVSEALKAFDKSKSILFTRWRAFGLD